MHEVATSIANDDQRRSQRSVHSVGKHIQLVVQADSLATIHLNRNLSSIRGDNIFTYSRILRRNISEDFRELAKILISNPSCQQVDTIYGITSFPKKLGDDFGFHSEELKPWSFDAVLCRYLIKKVRCLLGKKDLRGTTRHFGSLRRFSISREEFLALYLNTNNSIRS